MQERHWKGEGGVLAYPKNAVMQRVKKAGVNPAVNKPKKLPRMSSGRNRGFLYYNQKEADTSWQDCPCGIIKKG
ncbi:hypothetical protein DCCM_3711 [Desulfocucumis palustris]|uniref:Uncharacterized protein n=1 Tax=Desulfocucumis palustris TaxID=1898651 RepID=A0A2L2XEN2_9FIRM|nr:hypothetical protein DCCM_3711 [Desulfocucumis palustris]